MACLDCRESHSRKGWARRRWQALLKKMTGVYKVYVLKGKKVKRENKKGKGGIKMGNKKEAVKS